MNFQNDENQDKLKRWASFVKNGGNDMSVQESIVLKRFATFVTKTIDKIVSPLKDGETIHVGLFNGVRELISIMIPSSNVQYKFLKKYIKTLKDEKYSIAASDLNKKQSDQINQQKKFFK